MAGAKAVALAVAAAVAVPVAEAADGLQSSPIIASKWLVNLERPTPPGPRYNVSCFTLMPLLAKAKQAWPNSNAAGMAQNVSR